MIDLPATGRERVAVGVLVAAAVLFVGFAIPRTAVAGFFGALTLPLVLFAADLVIASAVLTRWYPLRPVAQGLAVFGILVHALVMLRSGPFWTRGCSGVLLLAHSWALVQLFMITAGEDDDAEEDGEAGAGPHADVATGVPAEAVETPVTEVVDLALPEEPGTPEEPAGPAPDERASDERAPNEPASDEPVSDEPVSDETGTDAAGADETASDELEHEPEHEHEERIR